LSIYNGQYRIRTNDQLRVKQLRYRCANRPYVYIVAYILQFWQHLPLLTVGLLFVQILAYKQGVGHQQESNATVSYPHNTRD
jgi:hypothetical protein